MFYFRTISEQPYPLPIIGCVIQRHEELLKRIAFEGSRVPASQARELTRNIIRVKMLASMNRALHKRGVRLVEVWMSFRRHHQVHFRFHRVGCPEASMEFSIVLYEPSKKAQTIERLRQEEDPDYDPNAVCYVERETPRRKPRRSKDIVTPAGTSRPQRAKGCSRSLC